MSKEELNTRPLAPYWKELEEEAKADGGTAKEIAALKNGFYVGVATAIMILKNGAERVVDNEISIPGLVRIVDGLHEEVFEYLKPLIEKEEAKEKS